MMRVLDLFSGIGGFSLGLERAGLRTVAFCEIEPFAARVLRKHWPEVPIYDDVRTLSALVLQRDGIGVDVICGGFPCQDISCAGKGAGLAGERSGLWREYARLIGEFRPRYVIVENVAALLGRGLDVVLGDMAALGFDAEWHCIPASHIGAPHRRDRVWIVAYACCGGRKGKPRRRTGQELADGCMERQQRPVANPNGRRWQAGHGDGARARHRHSPSSSGCDVLCDADGARLEIRQSITRDNVQEFAATVGADWWNVEPDVGRVAHGVSARVDRLRGLGNAVVPQVVELIGRAIIEHAGRECAKVVTNPPQPTTTHHSAVGNIT